MRYNEPFGSDDPNAPYVDRNTPGAVAGSRVPAAAIEHTQREIVAAIVANGLTPSANDLGQLAKAIAFAGTTERPGRVELATREEARLQTRGDVAVTPASLLDYQQRLVTNITYFVRADGNDLNTGLANTAAGAFRTIQRALDLISSLTAAGFSATINVGAGGFPDITAIGLVVPVQVVGAGRGATLISGTPSRNAVSADMGTQMTLAGVGFTDLGASGVVVGNGARVTLNNTKFFAANGRHIWAEEGGVVGIGGPVEVVGGAVNFVAAGIGSRVTMSGQTVTLSNNPAFTTFAEAFSGVIRARSVTFSGAATGSRYLAAAGGAIDTAGAGANYFPGNAAGSSPTGFYA